VPIKLSDLPLELQIQILSLLEWDDVLRARQVGHSLKIRIFLILLTPQTCRRIHDASLERPVWLALVKLYSVTVYPRPFCLEKPLDLYTDRELEHLVLRWQKAKLCWTLSQYKNIPIQRRFVSPEQAHKCVHLVEGGRWFLVGTNSGSILCHDLNASSIEPSILIPTPFDAEVAFDEYEDTEMLLSVDMDLEAEYLKFNLGIITRRMPIRRS
jgi:hypothetical protein